MDTITKESVVVYNNQKYKVTLEVTKLEDKKQPLSEGMFTDMGIKSYADPVVIGKLCGSRNIIDLHDALIKIDGYITAVNRLKSSSKTKHKEGAGKFYLGGSNTTKYSNEQLESFNKILRANRKQMEDVYSKMGGDQTYYAALQAKAQRDMANAQLYNAIAK